MPFIKLFERVKWPRQIIIGDKLKVDFAEHFRHIKHLTERAEEPRLYEVFYGVKDLGQWGNRILGLSFSAGQGA